MKGPAEPGLDAFIPELEANGATLDIHVTGGVLAEATRETQLARAIMADVDLSTWFRHIEGFLFNEANRRFGVNVPLAYGLYNAACPDGLAHIEDRIVDKNAHIAETLAVLRDPEQAAAIAAVKLPVVFINSLATALEESEAAIAEVTTARGDRTTHVDLGRDAEGTWVDLMVRLRRYMGSRAKRRDAVRLAEGNALLKPLLDAVQKQKADAATRATRRKTGKKSKTSTTSTTKESAPKNGSALKAADALKAAETPQAADAPKPADAREPSIQ